MAQVRIRPFSLYVGGKKIGQCHNVTFEINAGDEPQFGDNGPASMVGYSDGAVTTRMTCTTIQPVAGMDVDLPQILLGKQDVDIAVGVIAGHIYTVTHRFLKADYKMDTRTGALTGDFESGGGLPKQL